MKSNSEIFDVIHWTWDDNPDEALCGKDVTGEVWVTDDFPITCAKCLEIEEAIKWSEKMELEVNA
jgi:hypothetical protein